MGSLFGSESKVIPEFTGLQVNTAVQVLPIPIIYGSPRISINLVYYNGFNVQQVDASGGGKGLLGGGKGAKQTEYFATFIAAIGEGQLGEILIIYQDQDVWVPSNYPTNGAFYFNGSAEQMPWSYVQGTWPQDARSYKDTAYYAFQNAQLDSSATVPQIDLVLMGLFRASSPLNNTVISITSGQYDSEGNPLSFIGDIPLGNADADPAYVISDFLVNSTYGATFPTQFLDPTNLFTGPDGYISGVGDAALSTYCQAIGLAWSIVVNNVESANSILERWCKNLCVAPVWNGQFLRFFPYWDRYCDTNPGWDSDNVESIPRKYFRPNTTSTVEITLDQIIQSGNKDEDPVTFSRKDPWQVYNKIRIDFKDRTNFFNDVPATAEDEVHAELYGPRIDNIGLADEYSLGSYAQVSATVQLRRNISIVLTYTWKMGPLWAFLDPMDIVQIPDPTDYSNIIPVRIISCDDDDDENVTFVAENFPLGAQSSTSFPIPPTTPPNQMATNNPASPIYPPVMFEPTTSMLTALGFATPQGIIGLSGGNTSTFSGALDPNWGGANIWTSLDNVGYELLGRLTGPSIIGYTTQNLPAYVGGNPDNTDTIVVNLKECNGGLSGTTDAAASAGHSLCIIQDVSGYEAFTYTNATLIAANTYALTGLYRGLYGTTARGFGAGSQFLYIGTGANIFEQSLPNAYIGQNFWVKAQSFNVFNNATQELSEVVAYSYSAFGPTPPPLIPPPMSSPLTRRKRIAANPNGSIVAYNKNRKSRR